MREAVEVRPVTVTWHVMSLAVPNEGKDDRARHARIHREKAPRDGETITAAPAEAGRRPASPDRAVS